CRPGYLRDSGSWNVGQLHAGYSCYTPSLLSEGAVTGYLVDQPFQVAHSDMVGKSNSLITRVMGASQQL
ncbi:MAG: hypothetical protein Q8O76_10780, partial [Chloroflexota bacterium]|nr:hypothetical protein [Chloroflexota bacterium]